jgi:hypothetical protein
LIFLKMCLCSRACCSSSAAALSSDRCSDCTAQQTAQGYFRVGRANNACLRSLAYMSSLACRGWLSLHAECFSSFDSHITQSIQCNSATHCMHTLQCPVPCTACAHRNSSMVLACFSCKKGICIQQLMQCVCALHGFQPEEHSSMRIGP